MGIGFAAHADMGNRFASCADMGNRFAERVSWGVRTSAFQVRSCCVRFVVGALSAQSGQGMHETGRVDSPGAGCLVGPAQKTPFFGRFREVFFITKLHKCRGMYDVSLTLSVHTGANTEPRSRLGTEPTLGTEARDSRLGITKYK